MSEFIRRNKSDWAELEQLIGEARRSRQNLSPEKWSRLDVLYRRATVQLAQVTTRAADPRLRNYLNDLAAGAHSLIYRSARPSAPVAIGLFLYVGFARAVARSWRFQVAAVALTLGGALVGYYCSLHDVMAAYALLMPGDTRLPGSSKKALEDVLRSGRDQSDATKFVFSSFLFSHNLKVGLLALGTGVLVAFPTVLLLAYNGMMLGAFTALHHNAGIYSEYWAWILPHGVTEIGAIILCGGAGLMLGAAVLSPGLLTRGESLRRAGAEAMKIALGAAVMFFFAAIIESYLRQSYLSTAARLTFAAASAFFWAMYFLHGAVAERRSAGDSPSTRADSAAATPETGQ